MEAEKHENGFTQYLIEEGSGAKLPYDPKTGQIRFPDGKIIKLPDGTLPPEPKFETKEVYCPAVNQAIILETYSDYSTCIRINPEGKIINSLTADFGAKSKEEITGCNCREYNNSVNRLEQQIEELKK